jgi:hypothetical protein
LTGETSRFDRFLAEHPELADLNELAADVDDDFVPPFARRSDRIRRRIYWMIEGMAERLFFPYAADGGRASCSGTV